MWGIGIVQALRMTDIRAILYMNKIPESFTPSPMLLTVHLADCMVHVRPPHPVIALSIQIPTTIIDTFEVTTAKVAEVTRRDVGAVWTCKAQ